MKLKLSAEKDIQVLSASESISGRDIQVLRAGISKLFKNGKNKIAIELSAGQEIAPEALRELALLDVLARELSGRVMLAGITPDLQKRIALFADPPIITCFKSRTEAIQAFAPKPAPGPASPPAVGPATPAASSAGATPTGATPVGVTKDESEPAKWGELGNLRKRVVQLEKENEALREQMMAMVIERRTPPDAKAFETEIQSLENELEKALAVRAR